MMNVAFTFTTNTKDRSLALDRIAEIQSIYGSDIQIFVHSDGDIPAIAETGGVKFIPGRNVKGMVHGGRWTLRYMETFLLNSTSDFLVKIDPDSKVKRQITVFPEGPDILGNCFVSYPSRLPYVQGGCIGFPRKTVEKIVTSRRLLSKEFCGPGFCLCPGKRDDHNRGDRKLYAFQDAILYSLAMKLGLKIGPWSEISVFSHRLKDQYKPGDFAVIHPLSVEAKNA